jgi:endonuclease/exonuclease/phosphatase family metal-dependent hydrolase
VPVPERVSVATYNLYLGADLSILLGERSESEVRDNLDEVVRQLLATAFPQRAGLVAQALAEHDVDLVGLQEVCCWTVGGEQVWDFTALLLAALREHGADFEVVSEVSTFAGEGELPPDPGSGSGPVPVHVRGSNVVLRRTDSRVVVLESAHGLFEEAHEMHSLGTRRVSIARGWCGVRCRVGEHTVGFVDTHTEAYDSSSRDRQRDELLAACSAWDGDPLLVVGDFNATPDRVGMPEGFVDAWSVNSGDPGWTCCQDGDLANEQSRLSERIDYVWVRGAEVVSAALLGTDPDVRRAAGTWPSDHAGVHAVVELG